jgi:hypothetical protein
MGVLTTLRVVHSAEPDTSSFSELDLSDRLAYIHISNDGFGAPPIERHTEQGPLQHGTTDVGFNIQDRSIQLVLNALADYDDPDDYYDRRQEILSAFSPFLEPLYLEFVKPDGTEYRTRVWLQGGLSFSSQDKQGNFGHRITLQLKADPFFFALPERVETIALNDSTTLTNIGNAPAFPIINITGPATDLIIINTLNGRKLSFAGNSISSGTTVTVDTRYGYKTVKQGGTSVIEKLTTDSDLADFCIYPQSGDFNTFTTSATATSGATEIEFVWFDQYLGI